MNDGKISIKQLRALILLDAFGTGVIGLPRAAAELGGKDGWLLVAGATVLALFCAVILNYLAAMFSEESFHQYSGRIIGRPLGVILSGILAAKLIFSGGTELRILGEILRQTMLYNTPASVTCCAMALLGAYLAQKGYETRGRMAEMLLPVVFIPLGVVFAAAALNADFTNLLPVLGGAPKNVLRGSFLLSSAFRGIELTLLVYPFVKEKEKIMEGQLGAVLLGGAAVTLITAITLAKFGENDIKAQLWPVIQMADTFKLAGRLFERQDALLLCIWLISAFISLSGGIFFSARICGGLLKGNYILPATAAVFAVSLIPADVSEARRFLAAADLTTGTAYALIIPLLLIIIAKARGMGGKRYEG